MAEFVAPVVMTDGLDLSKTKLKRAAIEDYSTAPSSPVAQQIYYDTALKRLRIYADGAWQDFEHYGARSGWLASVHVAFSGTSLDLTAAPSSTLDGVTLTVGDRVLVIGQTNAADNGIYVVGASAWTRAPDMPVGAKFSAGFAIAVMQGTAFGGRVLIPDVVNSNGSFVIGTDGLAFRDLRGANALAVGSGLLTTGNVLNLKVNTAQFRFNGSNELELVPGSTGLKYSTNVGDGTSTLVTVTHNLNTRDVIVCLYRNGSNYNEVVPGIAHATANTITLDFGSNPPATNAYRVVVMA